MKEGLLKIPRLVQVKGKTRDDYPINKTYHDFRND